MTKESTITGQVLYEGSFLLYAETQIFAHVSVDFGQSRNQRTLCLGEPIITMSQSCHPTLLLPDPYYYHRCPSSLGGERLVFTLLTTTGSLHVQHLLQHSVAMMPIDQLAMSSYMQPSGSVREDCGPQDGPSWSIDFAYSLSKSQPLLAASSRSAPTWRIFGIELLFREGERPGKGAVRSRTNVPYLRMSTGGILEESDLFQKVLTGLLHVDGARSIGEWRNMPGISDHEQRVNLRVSRLVDCPPEGVVPPSRRASLKSSQIATKSFDPASAMPSNVHISADVIGQSIKVRRPSFGRWVC